MPKELEILQELIEVFNSYEYIDVESILDILQDKYDELEEEFHNHQMEIKRHMEQDIDSDDVPF